MFERVSKLQSCVKKEQVDADFDPTPCVASLFAPVKYVRFSFPLSCSGAGIHCVCTHFNTLAHCLCTVTELVYFEWSELSTAVSVMHHSSGHILPTLSICSRPAFCVCMHIFKLANVILTLLHEAKLHQQYSEEKAESAYVCLSVHQLLCQSWKNDGLF